MPAPTRTAPWGPRGSFLLTEDRLEALSRLLFVCDQRRPFAVLSGPSGVGKSRLFDELERQLRHQRRKVVRLDVSGVDRHEVPIRLLSACGITEALSSAWQHVEDVVTGQGLAGDGGVWLIDHLDDSGDLSAAVHRLSLLLERPDVQGTVVVATTDSTQLGRLGSRADWPIVLHRWTAEDTAAAIELLQESHPLPRFSSEALTAIAEIAGGCPAKILHVCELSSLAAEVNGFAAIDEDLVREVARQAVSSPLEDFLWTGTAS